ncbi:MAG: hypothetical protein ABR569_13155 [Gaiellaceae bacterium]
MGGSPKAQTPSARFRSSRAGCPGRHFSAPDADRFNYTERKLRAKIKVALGGRAAEEIVFGDLTTGAESDIQKLTHVARQMVGRWGMSRVIGTIAVLPMERQGPLLPRG